MTQQYDFQGRMSNMLHLVRGWRAGSALTVAKRRGHGLAGHLAPYPSSVTAYLKLSVRVLVSFSLIIYAEKALITRYEATQVQGAKTSCPARPIRDCSTGSPYAFKLG